MKTNKDKQVGADPDSPRMLIMPIFYTLIGAAFLPIAVAIATSSFSDGVLSLWDIVWIMTLVVDSVIMAVAVSISGRAVRRNNFGLAFWLPIVLTLLAYSGLNIPLFLLWKR